MLSSLIFLPFRPPLALISLMASLNFELSLAVRCSGAGIRGDAAERDRVAAGCAGGAAESSMLPPAGRHRHHLAAPLRYGRLPKNFAIESSSLQKIRGIIVRIRRDAVDVRHVIGSIRRSTSGKGSSGFWPYSSKPRLNLLLGSFYTRGLRICKWLVLILNFSITSS